MSKKGGYKKIDPAGGNTFSSTNQPANRGRKKLLTTMAKEKGYSSDEIIRVMAHVLTMTKSERKAHYTDGDPDGLEAAAIRAVEKAISSGDWSKIQHIIENIAGRPTQRHKHDINSGEVTIKIVRE